jgi:hypothetical protein
MPFKIKLTLLSRNSFFLSFYIGFIVDLKVIQGYDCNLHILNIIKQDLSARVDGVCGAFRPLNATFNDGV